MRIDIGRYCGRLLEQPVLSLLAWLVIPVLVAIIFGEQVDSAYRRPYFLGLGLAILAIVALIVNSNWRSLRSSIRFHVPEDWRLHVGWMLVVLAIALRHTCMSICRRIFPASRRCRLGAGRSHKPGRRAASPLPVHQPHGGGRTGDRGRLTGRPPNRLSPGLPDGVCPYAANVRDGSR